MKKYSILLAGLAVAVALTGCVSSKKYNQAVAERDAIKADYTTMLGKYNDADSKHKTVQALLETEKENNRNLRDDYARLQRTLEQSVNSNSQGNVNIARLVDQINESNAYIRQLVTAKNKSDSLNMALTANLTRSLTPEERNEVNVKVLKGVVYISLADNMLFRSGSYEINSRAMTTLSKIADILKDYGNYHVLVEGNTDTVPISRTNIRNNWDLSTLRASSVVQALQNDFGIDPKRLTAGGRGEYNPVADNGTAAGRQRNRRTEIIITPDLDQFMDLIDKAPEEAR